MVSLMRPIVERGACYRMYLGHRGTGLLAEVFRNRNQANKKPGLNEGSAGITSVPGLFSELFNVAASRPAQMTTE
jgi:hypothetical protein